VPREFFTVEDFAHEDIIDAKSKQVRDGEGR
jgi:hypothetical protein